MDRSHKGSDLRLPIEVFIATQEGNSLGISERRPRTKALEQTSHSTPSRRRRSWRRLTPASPRALARPGNAHGNRAKSKYYDAAAPNFERARRCYEGRALPPNVEYRTAMCAKATPQDWLPVRV